MIATRLETLAELEEGWLDGKGYAPDKAQLTWLSTAFDTLFDLHPRPKGRGWRARRTQFA